MKRLALTSILLFSSAGFATTVYKTVDDRGVVEFSDSPPQGAASAEVLNISASEPQSPQEYLASLEAMRVATERLASDRREREAHRAQLREIRARTESYQIPEQPRYTQYGDYLPVYSGGYRQIVRPPYRPGFRPRPLPPVALPRGGSVISSNRQLMRPLVSGRR